MLADIPPNTNILCSKYAVSGDQHHKEDGKSATGSVSRIHAVSSVGERYRAKFARVNANLKSTHKERQSRTAPANAVSDAACHAAASEEKSQNLFVETRAESAEMRIPRLCCSLISTGSSL
jgi:hypothetical protein